MNNEQSINIQIQKEYDAYNNSPYSGEPALPKDLIQRFEKAIWNVPPSAHRMSTELIKRILGKKLKDLNNMDVPFILNTISAAPFNLIYKNMDEALKGNKEIEDLKVAINITVQQINAQLETKRANMLALSNPTKQPLKLVKAQA